MTLFSKILSVLFLFFLVINAAQGQSKKEIDQYCNCLNTSTEADSVKVQTCFGQTVAKSFSKIKDEKKRKYFLIKFDSDLQRDCPEFKKITQAQREKNGDWGKLEANLPSKLTPEICQNFTKHKRLYYLEPTPTADTTNVYIENGIWLERLRHDKFFSKLELKMKSNCEFDLIFIDSNDPVKRNMSTEGEKYTYRLIDKKENYYLITVAYSVVVYQFRLYFE